jgi:hypothetical protein
MTTTVEFNPATMHPAAFIKLPTAISNESNDSTDIIIIIIILIIVIIYLIKKYKTRE